MADTEMRTVESKAVAEDMAAQLKERPDVTQVHSSVENAAPVVKVDVDPIKAQAEGLTPASVGSVIYSTLSGVTAMTLNTAGEDIDVKVEFAPDEYDNINQLEGILLTTPAGTQVPLSDIADIYYQDSPQTIQRSDKQYQVAITCQPVEGYEETAETDVKQFAAAYAFPAGVSNAANAMDEMMVEELSGLMGAIGTAIFLIFVVMAMQFESPKFSFMVGSTRIRISAATPYSGQIGRLKKPLLKNFLVPAASTTTSRTHPKNP